MAEYTADNALKHPMYRKNRLVVFDRDQDCHICGGYVDQTLPSKHLMGRVADHVHPRKRGGHLWSLDNLKLAHNYCNGVKSDMTMEELGLMIINQCKVVVKQAQSELKSSGRNFALELDGGEDE